VLDAWVVLVSACRGRAMPIIYTTPVSRADGADVVLLPTDLSVQTGVPSLTNCIEGTPEAGFPEEIAPRPQDYVFLKRRPSAFYGTGVAELLRTLRRTALVIGGGATNRGVEIRYMGGLEGPPKPPDARQHRGKAAALLEWETSPGTPKLIPNRD
jgi:nicotinamidase-related amidase